ncbi:hypothetical protein BofuT4_uP029190.1 [Botrytis cinerea T4]|uniref:Uncharacterized protein n=1 Tax=Botryotinia fuckeliana (strain T4) TaxID=999810 RepID=G2Y8W7_BOTF4|nr:hypothetical protein BofuT4_uP029190.1 [Botrytis cinerea T4]
MDLHGNNHWSNECKLDHECHQETEEAVQKVHRQVIHRNSNRYELGHESDQAARQANQDHNNRSE